MTVKKRLKKRDLLVTQNRLQFLTAVIFIFASFTYCQIEITWSMLDVFMKTALISRIFLIILMYSQGSFKSLIFPWPETKLLLLYPRHASHSGERRATLRSTPGHVSVRELYAYIITDFVSECVYVFVGNGICMRAGRWFRTDKWWEVVVNLIGYCLIRCSRDHVLAAATFHYAVQR